MTLPEAPQGDPDPLGEAIKALEAEGIPATQANIEKWFAAHGEPGASKRLRRAFEAHGVRIAEKEPQVLQPVEPRSPRPEDDDIIRRRGRRPIDPPWYIQLAGLVANGTPLRRALWRLGIRLTEREMKNIYRHKMFRIYLDEARVARWQAQFPKRDFSDLIGEF